jgi:hypothetical protein
MDYLVYHEKKILPPTQNSPLAGPRRNPITSRQLAQHGKEKHLDGIQI